MRRSPCCAACSTRREPTTSSPGSCSWWRCSRQFEIRSPGRPEGREAELAALAHSRRRQPDLHPDRHAAGGSPPRVRLRARDQPLDGRAGPHRRALLPGAQPVELDQELDGLALDGHLPGAQRHPALGPRPARGSPAPRRAAAGGGLSHRGDLPQRLGGSQLRLRPGIPESTSGRSPASRPGKRTPRSHERLKGTDEDATQAAFEFLRTYGDERFLLYLHYMDVHQYTYTETLRALRLQLLRRLRQRHPLDRPEHRRAAPWSSTSWGCATAPWW